MKRKNKSKKPGPRPETLKIKGDVNWKDALKHALNKPKPEGGWPKDGDEQGDECKDKGQQK